MSAVAVPHRNSKDESWRREGTIFKQPSLVKSGWGKSADENVCLTHTNHLKKRTWPRGWMQVTQRDGNVQYTKNDWPVVGGF